MWNALVSSYAKLFIYSIRLGGLSNKGYKILKCIINFAQALTRIEYNYFLQIMTIFRYHFIVLSSCYFPQVNFCDKIMKVIAILLGQNLPTSEYLTVLSFTTLKLVRLFVRSLERKVLSTSLRKIQISNSQKLNPSMYM